MIYLDLFLSFLQVGMFSVGGGYAAISLIQEQAVTVHEWMTVAEFTDLVTIAEMTPGPIAINAATFVGTRQAGMLGAAVATLGCIVPSLIIVSILAWCYQRYREGNTMQTVLSCLRPAVVSLIASAALSILWHVVFSDHATIAWSSIQWPGVILFIGALFVLIKTKKSPILVMMCCGLLYLGYSLLLDVL